MGMTQEQFRKEGWLKHFAQYSEEELATIVLCANCLVEMGLWTDLVWWCESKIRESLEDRLHEENEKAEVLH
jgi:hypothetical protein|tara:strand:- start:168 stop:383 length:216 start_codon:yes stop_codon:yes gene_type:complete